MKGSVAMDSNTMAAPIEDKDLLMLKWSSVFARGTYNPFVSHNRARLPFEPLLASSRVANLLNG